MGLSVVSGVKTTKSIITAGVFTAVLIGAQLALSGVAGVEIVTVLLLSFCYRCGVKQGMLVVNAFTLLRCFVFGFFPNVMVLYFVYYNLFAAVFGLIGGAFKRVYGVRKHIVVVIVAVVMTALFTVADNIVTPVMYGFTLNAAKAYWIASVYTAVPQMLCSLVTSLLLFPPLLKFMQTSKF